MSPSSGDLMIPNDTRLVARLRVLHGLDELAKNAGSMGEPSSLSTCTR